MEIGWTWITPGYQRTYIQHISEILQDMLTQAFEEWGAMRVEFKTDFLNQKSRTALARIGAKEEVSRSHLLCRKSCGDSVYFSVLDNEWSEVKKNLEKRIYSS